MSPAKAYLFLAFAIVAEVIGTTALKASDSFTKPLPSLVTVGCYALSFYLLTFSLRILPTGIAYAIWSGVGIVLISLISWAVYGQRLDLPAIAGLALIIAGVAVINLFSNSVSH
ncbi:QacE family quaternary ammonium compound efflux SMR transporter [Massilia sp. IC2-477]|uniref:SMR family transporter n=1 Tax=unclassified Massilia TaxID=2609279 RepID=UPI001D10673B|nr:MULTISPECIES: SMR family transporter [unclassified Massilia]MCC2958078.1 QacE family quaternary ammonium compound efflux SMR transporter [Massilia sp. IC2-477]MCC2971382.1 QacE family quaternary ammonium compound efflux SMR transporter [Massilia sp. IC2-476]